MSNLQTKSKYDTCTVLIYTIKNVKLKVIHLLNKSENI